MKEYDYGPLADKAWEWRRSVGAIESVRMEVDYHTKELADAKRRFNEAVKRCDSLELEFKALLKEAANKG